MHKYKKVKSYLFKEDDPLGTGSYGTVYKAVDESNDEKIVAIKAISHQISQDPLQFKLLNREVDVLIKMKSQYTIQLIDVAQTVNNYYIIMEFCNGGSLDDLMQSGKIFTEEEALKIVKQIAAAFLSINDLGIEDSKSKKFIIMHRDLKPANILLHDKSIKIADFGFARFILEEDQDQVMGYSSIGTPYYMSPQILNDELYSQKCDIWSAGIILYQMVYGKKPWYGSSKWALHKNIVNIPMELEKEGVKDTTKDLITKMLTFEDEARISWKDVFEHSALQEIEL